MMKCKKCIIYETESVIFWIEKRDFSLNRDCRKKGKLKKLARDWMCNYNSMVNAFFKLDGHMFCLDSFSFCFFPFAKKLIIRNELKDFQIQCNLDENGIEICFLRLFFLFLRMWNSILYYSHMDTIYWSCRKLKWWFFS